MTRLKDKPSIAWSIANQRYEVTLNDELIDCGQDYAALGVKHGILKYGVDIPLPKKIPQPDIYQDIDL